MKGPHHKELNVFKELIMVDEAKNRNLSPNTQRKCFFPNKYNCNKTLSSRMECGLTKIFEALGYSNKPGLLTHRHCEVINVCDFIPVNFWCFIIQQLITNSAIFVSKILITLTSVVITSIQAPKNSTTGTHSCKLSLLSNLWTV